jgi:hypothetical protein
MADKTLKENLASIESLIGSLEKAGINVGGIRKAFFDEVVPQAGEPAGAEGDEGDMSVKEMLRRLNDPREALASDDPVTDADPRKEVGMAEGGENPIRYGAQQTPDPEEQPAPAADPAPPSEEELGEIKQDMAPEAAEPETPAEEVSQAPVAPKATEMAEEIMADEGDKEPTPEEVAVAEETEAEKVNVDLESVFNIVMGDTFDPNSSVDLDKMKRIKDTIDSDPRLRRMAAEDPDRFALYMYGRKSVLK